MHYVAAIMRYNERKSVCFKKIGLGVGKFLKVTPIALLLFPDCALAQTKPLNPSSSPLRCLYKENQNDIQCTVVLDETVDVTSIHLDGCMMLQPPPADQREKLIALSSNFKITFSDEEKAYRTAHNILRDLRDRRIAIVPTLKMFTSDAVSKLTPAEQGSVATFYFFINPVDRYHWNDRFYILLDSCQKVTGWTIISNGSTWHWENK